ncbi:hypothetical protein ACQ86O_17865 [Serratia sp. L9]|uniref:hypothetical protein n=1 Tax=Serratia sp. L9 TaxID=3423946 RepID=UPI003D678DE2
MHQTNKNTTSATEDSVVVESTPVRIATGTGADSSLGLNLSTMSTSGAAPISLSVASQDNLLASIETRLAEEMRDLVSALLRFGIGTQRINEELPETAQFGKLITRFFSITSLQLAYAFLKDRDKPLLLDDGAQQLQDLGLSLNDFIREIDLEGRQFLAIALIDKRFSDLTNGSNGTD